MKKALMSAGCPEDCAEQIAKASGVQGFDWATLAKIFAFYSDHKDEFTRLFSLAMEFWAIINPAGSKKA